MGEGLGEDAVLGAFIEGSNLFRTMVARSMPPSRGRLSEKDRVLELNDEIVGRAVALTPKVKAYIAFLRREEMTQFLPIQRAARLVGKNMPKLLTLLRLCGAYGPEVVKRTAKIDWKDG